MRLFAPSRRQKLSAIQRRGVYQIAEFGARPCLFASTVTRSLFHTPYLARLAEEAAEGFEEARERFAGIPRYADLDPAHAFLVEALEVSAIEHGFADWREMEMRMREIRAGRAEERSIDFFHEVEGAKLAAVSEHLYAEADLVNAVASTQKSALHSVGSAEMAELLLERGADPRIETMLPGGTALMHAIIARKMGHPPRMRWMGPEGGDIRRVQEGWDTHLTRH